MNKLRLKYSNVVLLIFLYALIFPTFKNILGNTLGYGLLHISLIIISFTTLHISKYNISKKIIFLGLITTIVILTSTLFNSKILSPKDILEIHRPFLYILTFLLPFVIKWDLHIFNKFLKILLIIFIFFVFLSINSSFSISPEITSWYNSTTHMYRSRYSGTFPNPYDFGYILLLPFFVSLIYILSKSRIWIKFSYTLILILSVVMLIGTQSRTSLLGLLFGLLYLSIIFPLLFFKFKSLRFFKINIYIFLVFLIATSITIISYNNLKANYSYLFVGIESFIKTGRTGSTDSRIAEFNHVKASYSGISDILIGNGVSKGEIKNLESSYLLYPFRYGLYGIFLIILIFGFTITYSFKNIFKYKDTNWVFHSFIIGLHIWFVITPFVSLTNCYIDMPRVQFIYFFLFGLTLTLYKHNSSLSFCRIVR